MTTPSVMPDAPSRRLARGLVTLPRGTKQLIMLLADGLALPGCLLLAVWLVTPEIAPILPVWLWAVPPVIGVTALRISGFYRSVVRFMGLDVAQAAFKVTSWVALTLLACVTLVDKWPDGLRVAASFWFLSMVYLVGSRLVVRGILQSRNATGDRVVIYGAGEAGAHLISALLGRGEFVPVAFIDDNPALSGAVVNGLEVAAPTRLASLIDEFGVSRVLLALPSVSRRRRLEIINQLEQFPVHVQTMPDTVDLAAGNARVDEVREVDITDLLGRDAVPPNPKLLDACIRGKSV